jgi:type VI secretion system protein ImpL
MGGPALAGGLIIGIALSIAVWFLGEGLAIAGRHPFDNPYDRCLVIGLAAVAWLGWLARFLWSRRSAATTLPKGLGRSATRAEFERIRACAVAAAERVAALRIGPRSGGRAVYQLPWYLAIGVPGAGRSGLLRALEPGLERVRPTAEAPDGGDWWMSDRVVLIDADEATLPDERAWKCLLDSIKERRPRQPVNGVLLVLSLADLARWTARERQLYGELLGRRLAEVADRLGRPPLVHIVATMADRIGGFTAFFDLLTAEERRQPWGACLPFDGFDRASIEDTVHDIVTDLVRRLDALRLDRLYQEPDRRRRAAAFGFPLHFAALEQPLRDVLAAIWAGPSGAKAPRLRGLLFTAARPGDGEGAPDGLAAVLGLPPPPEPHEVAAPSFFVERLLPDVILPEAGLAGEDERLKWRRRIRQTSALAAMLVAAVGASAFWINSYRGNLALIDEAAAGVLRVETALRPLDTPPRALNRIDDTDFAALVPALNAMRELPGGYLERGKWPPILLSGGFYQGIRLGQPAEAMYARTLRSQFLSRIALRVEEAMRAAWLRPDLLQPALRAYLMIGGKLPVDRAYLTRWLATDWQKTFADDENLRRTLGEHLAALFELGFAPVPLDETLVDRAQKLLERAPLANP